MPCETYEQYFVFTGTFCMKQTHFSVTHSNHWNLLVLYATVSFGASEAVKDIFPLFITVAFHYVFPANSFWVKSFGC